jgi:thioesterase domain-containing protein
MGPTELEQYLRNHIPLARAMEVSVMAVHPDSLILRAPLAPNANPHHTVFGGSGATLALLAAWSLVHVRLQDAAVPCHLVIRRSTMEYERPIAGMFTARAWIEGPSRWLQFTEALVAKGKARLSVSSTLEYEGDIAGRFTGEFVAIHATSTRD